MQKNLENRWIQKTHLNINPNLDVIKKIWFLLWIAHTLDNLVKDGPIPWNIKLSKPTKSIIIYQLKIGLYRLIDVQVNKTEYTWPRWFHWLVLSNMWGKNKLNVCYSLKKVETMRIFILQARQYSSPKTEQKKKIYKKRKRGPLSLIHIEKENSYQI